MAGLACPRRVGAVLATAKLMTSPDYLERKRQEILSRAQGGARHAQMRYCRHDRRMVRAIGPSRIWHAAAPAIGIVGFLVVIAVTFADPIGISTLIAALLYIAALGPAIELGRRVPRCALCGREVPYHDEAEAMRARPLPGTASSVAR